MSERDHHILRIAVLLDTDLEFGMRILRGVQTYARRQAEWQLLTLHYTQESVFNALLHQGRLSGVLGPVLSDRWQAGLPGAPVPMVNISDHSEIHSVPSVITDNLQAGRLAARQLVYGDARANPQGRLPDDTWILRPQDLPTGFQPLENTWYFPRVAGTFKERAGFHGCQMPEQLLGRIIRACSHPDQVVLDPFAGSGTTLAVAKKLGRHYLGIELSADYTREIRKRLRGIRSGDALDGAPEPLVSAPTTAAGRKLDTRVHGRHSRRPRTPTKGQKALPGLD